MQFFTMLMWSTAAAFAAEPVVPILLINHARVNTLFAEATAAKIMNEAGIRIEWLYRADASRKGLLVMELLDAVPASLAPGKLAESMPYQGTSINVAMPRILPIYGPASRRHLLVLAHVMAHEIGHMLIGSDYHADAGLMSARWTRAEHYEMTFEPLRFAPADVTRLHRGLAHRIAALESTRGARVVPLGKLDEIP